MFTNIRAFIKKILVFLGVAVGSFVVLFLVFGFAGLYESSGLLSGFAVASVLILPIVFGALVVRKKFPRVPSAAPADREEKAEEQIPPAVAEAPAPVLDYKQRRAAYIEHKREEFNLELSQIPRVPVAQSSERTKRANMIRMPEIKYSNITRSTNLANLFPLVVVDTETTGVKPGGNDIIEVSAIKYGPDFAPISCFTSLCKPRKPIPADATEVNNITDEMVAAAPPFALIAPSFSEYIAGCNVVGHNLPFDLRFLYISGVELPPKAKYYDTLDLAKKVLTKYGGKKYNHKSGEYEEVEDWDVYDYKLDTLCEYYDVYRNDAHRSLSDAYATGLLFKNLIDDKTS
ncbi:MAG: 3'-5' exonuclease [Clostridiales bacterium]|nr:3'-5' exonuclease [Clostridiales bacterium]